MFNFKVAKKRLLKTKKLYQALKSLNLPPGVLIKDLGLFKDRLIIDKSSFQPGLKVKCATPLCENKLKPICKVARYKAILFFEPLCKVCRGENRKITDVANMRKVELCHLCSRPVQFRLEGWNIYWKKHKRKKHPAVNWENYRKTVAEKIGKYPIGGIFNDRKSKDIFYRNLYELSCFLWLRERYPKCRVKKLPDSRFENPYYSAFKHLYKIGFCPDFEIVSSSGVIALAECKGPFDDKAKEKFYALENYCLNREITPVWIDLLADSSREICTTYLMKAKKYHFKHTKPFKFIIYGAREIILNEVTGKMVDIEGNLMELKNCALCNSSIPVRIRARKTKKVYCGNNYGVCLAQKQLEQKDLKKCSVCKKILPISDFYRAPSSDQLFTSCKLCKRNYAKKCPGCGEKMDTISKKRLCIKCGNISYACSVLSCGERITRKNVHQFRKAKNGEKGFCNLHLDRKTILHFRNSAVKPTVATEKNIGMISSIKLKNPNFGPKKIQKLLEKRKIKINIASIKKILRIVKERFRKAN